MVFAAWVDKIGSFERIQQGIWKGKTAGLASGRDVCCISWGKKEDDWGNLFNDRYGMNPSLNWINQIGSLYLNNKKNVEEKYGRMSDCHSTERIPNNQDTLVPAFNCNVRKSGRGSPANNK